MLIAKCRIKMNGKYVLPNEKFDAKKELADDLIKRGCAVDEKSLPAGGLAVNPDPLPSVTQTAQAQAQPVVA